MNDLRVSTPEELAERAEANEEDAFTAIRVATRLSKRLQEDRARQTWLSTQLAGQPSGELAPIATRTLPRDEAVRFAVLAIRICAADPALRPHVEDAMQEEAEAREMIGTGVLEIGVVVGLVLLVAKTEVRRDESGKWTFHLHPMSDAALAELAKLGTQALKLFTG